MSDFPRRVSLLGTLFKLGLLALVVSLVYLLIGGGGSGSVIASLILGWLGLGVVVVIGSVCLAILFPLAIWIWSGTPRKPKD